MNEPHWEPSLSAALDGELGPDEVRELLDAMASTPGCRESWRAQRALDRRLQPLTRPAAPPLRPRRRGLRTAGWIAPLAAAALLALMLLRPDSSSGPSLPDPEGRPLTVRLAADEGRMTEARFVELVVEVLRADQRYQDKMREVLEEVRPAASLAEAGGPESGGIRSERLAFHRDAESLPRSARLPSGPPAGIH